MKKIYLLIIVLLLLTAFKSGNNDAILQISTLQALQEGYYDGVVALKEIGRQGDTGIGTVNALDGELIELDNKFYQVKSDGNVYDAGENLTTPFVVTTVFNSDKNILIGNMGSYKELQDYIESLLPSKNIIYAFKIKANLKYVKTRSVPRQEKPYPRLSEVVKNQPIFEYHDVSGTIVGFWFPEYLKGVNMSGFHFHFITDDRKHGGHLLECVVNKADIGVDYTNRFNLILPSSNGFYNIDLSKDKSGELLKIEK